MEWNEFLPWQDKAMVEQDLIISRALVAIFSDDFLASQLAFRGGTALHKLYLSPQPRFSEDIDLVQITAGPIKPIMYRLGEVFIQREDKLYGGGRGLTDISQTGTDSKRENDSLQTYYAGCDVLYYGKNVLYL